MRKIKKAIIPVAGYGTRFLPITKSIPKEMLPILNKPIIQYIVEEAISSGIEEIIFIISNKKSSLVNYFKRDIELENHLLNNEKENQFNEIKCLSNMTKFIYVKQNKQLGLGHAILMAKNLINKEPFALLLGDEVIYNENQPALKQLINVYNSNNNSILGVQNVEKKLIKNYGIIESNDNLEITKIIEKPSINQTNSTLSVIGRYIFNYEIFNYLETQKPNKKNNEIQLTDSIQRMISDNIKFNFEIIKGTRYDLGSIDGFVKAQIDFYKRRNENN